jgi:hypothetical protein
MKPEIKQKWIEALRSGEYDQGKHYLRNTGNQYCCLGVLCDIYSKETEVEWDDTLAKDGRFCYQFLNASGYLPIEVQHWAEIEYHGGWVDPGRSLTYLNDSGESFETIAQKIEEKL